MLKKRLLRSAILRLSAFEVVRRIQIQQRQRLDRAVHIEGVAVNNLVGNVAGLFDAVGVQFDAVSHDFRISGDHLESATIPDAGIQRRTSRDRKRQEALNPFRLRQWKRKIAGVFACRPSAWCLHIESLWKETNRDQS